MEQTVQAVITRYGGDATRLMDILIDIQDELGCLTHDTATQIARALARASQTARGP